MTWKEQQRATRPRRYEAIRETILSRDYRSSIDTDPPVVACVYTFPSGTQYKYGACGGLVRISPRAYQLQHAERKSVKAK